MTNKSFICNFIKEHPLNWQTLITEKNIIIKFDGNYAIFNYGINPNFMDPIVQEARGIILHIPSEDVTTFPPTVSCWAFRKFGLWDCYYADKIDWDSAVVLDKIDGSIIKLWFDLEIHEWRISTDGIINAEEAKTPDNLSTFKELTEIAMKKQHLQTDNLNIKNTYIFELVSYHNQNVVQYNTNAMIYHIGTRNNYTGEELEEDIGIQKPVKFVFKNLDECIFQLNQWDKQCTRTGKITKEGFVVVDKNYNRIKIKTESYLFLHQLICNGNSSINKKRIVKMILNPTFSPDFIIKQIPTMGYVISWYMYQIELYKERARQIYYLSKRLFDEYDGDHKRLASIISKHELSWIGFLAVRTNKSFDDIMEDTKSNCWKYLKDYKKVNVISELEEMNALGHE